jgi:hypothetical protein
METMNYGYGTNVPCYCCSRPIFLDLGRPVELETREAQRWVKLQCARGSCKSYQQPYWYPEESLTIR